MQLKTFTGATMAQVMELVREELGEDAIIVSNGRGPGGRGARVTAALERADDEIGLLLPDDDVPMIAEDVAGVVRQALTFHGTPNVVRQPVLENLDKLEQGDPVVSLGATLERYFTFSPLPMPDPTPRTKQRFLLVGAPGCGKTLVAAKLATRAHVAGAPFQLISADNVHAGGAAALQAFANILGSQLILTDGPQGLADTLSAPGPGQQDPFTIIDTMGANPYNEQEVERLDSLIKASDAEPVLVLAAGGDPIEAASCAAVFARLGAKRVIITRLDASRRYGGLLAAAYATNMAFAEAGLSSHVPDGLAPIGAQSLARFLLPDPVVNPNLRKEAS